MLAFCALSSIYLELNQNIVYDNNLFYILYM